MMKTSVETVSGVEKRIRVEYQADEVSKRIEEGYTEVRRMVPIRGFRKGKAPLSMVKRLFKDHVESDVAEHLVKESITEAIKENNLRVLSPPKIDGGRIAEGEMFAFTATFEVVPDIAPAGYKGLEVTKEKVEVTEDQVEAAMASLRESFARFQAVEGRAAGENDLVEISFSSSSGGDPIESGQPANVILGGGGPFGKEFEAVLYGMKAGEERTAEVEYPLDAPQKKYAGKKVSFHVTVNAVREKHLPDMDDEFVKNFGDVGSLAELRSKVAERLRAEGEEQSRRRTEEDIRKGLLERNAFEVPRTLVDRQIYGMIEDMANRLASQGMDLKKVSMDFEKMRERFAPIAEQAVRASLLLSAIARQENIDVPFSEIEAELKDVAAAAGMPYEKVREIYGDEERLDGLRNRILERKVMDFLLVNAHVREEVSSE